MNEIIKQFDLEERTAKFGEEVILFCKNIKENSITRPVISQVVRSSTSIGANYAESQAACSRKDFKNKIHICKKEAQESVYWLRMFSIITPEQIEKLASLKREASELLLIFGKITSKLNKNT